MICPVCGAEIEYLECASKVYDCYHYYITEDGTLMREFLETQPSDEIEFRCPVCWDLLFNNEDDALDFLYEENNPEWRRIDYRTMVRDKAFCFF